MFLYFLVLYTFWVYRDTFSRFIILVFKKTEKFISLFLMPPIKCQVVYSSEEKTEPN